MMVVFYDPADGRIEAFVQGSEMAIEADTRPFVEVTERRDDWDVTHKVVNGQVVEA